MTAQYDTEQLDRDLLTLVREVVPRERSSVVLKPEQSLQALGIDSLGKATLAFRLEEKYGVDLVSQGANIVNIRTIADVLKIAKSAIQASGR